MRWTRQKPTLLPNSNIDSVPRLRRPTAGAAPDDFLQKRLGLGVALEHRTLAALLVVEHEAERESRAARPMGIRRRRAVADEVPLGHDRRATASISISTPGGNPAWTDVRAG